MYIVSNKTVDMQIQFQIAFFGENYIGTNDYLKVCCQMPRVSLRCLTTLRSKFRTAFEFLPVTPLKTREVTEKDGVLRNTANRATFFTI